MNAHDVVVLGTDDTLALRTEVLRRGTPSDDPRFDEDSLPGTEHLGIVVDGEVVATSTWLPRECPVRPEVVGVQLRGMAVAGALQGTGLGAAIIAAGLARARSAGAEIVWANARDTALGFYEKLGFVVHGEGFVEANTLLPHHVMSIDL